MTRSTAIFFLAFLPRLAYLFLNFPGVPSPGFYWSSSGSFLRFGILGYEGKSVTAVEPLYPFFLAFARILTADRVFPVFVAQIALSSVAAILLYRLVLFLSGEKGGAWLAAFYYSFYPYLVRQSAVLSEVSLLTTLLILGASTFLRARSPKGFALSGFVWGLVLLTRTAALPVVVFGAAALALRRQFVNAAVFLGLALLLLLPFSLRNFSIDGSLLPTRSGVNLYDGNNSYTDALLPRYSLDLMHARRSEVLQQEGWRISGARESEIDRFWTAKALQFMKENPLWAVKRRLLNLFYFFHPRIVPFYPSSPETRIAFGPEGTVSVENASGRSRPAEWAHTVFYSFLLGTALWGVWLRRREAGRDLMLYLIVAGFAAVSAWYWPATRLRAPTDFVLMIYSAVAVWEGGLKKVLKR